MSSDALGKLRQEIDQLDKEIQLIINRRAVLAQNVAEVKHKEQTNPVYYRPEREAQVLRDVKARNEGPLSDSTMAYLFREIMSACLALEKPLQVAYLGPVGTYTQAAATKHFGDGAQLKPLGTIAEVFREIEAGGADFGVVPVENSTEGVVNHTLDMFLKSPLSIASDIEMPIHHQLLSVKGVQEGIRQVCAHQQALAQCREWLDANFPNIPRVAVSSNAEAASLAVKDESTAAIASDAAATLYNLTMIACNIEDDPNNTTRFLVIGNQLVDRSGDDKTSLMVSVHNNSGALYRLLQPLAKHGVSMTRIESRPSRLSKWDYVFFVDLDGHVSDDNIASALAELKNEAVQVKVLGSYPRSH
ncbi:MAG: prephenate dehydratase [Gammaproteobacteria bacterium]